MDTQVLPGRGAPDIQRAHGADERCGPQAGAAEEVEKYKGCQRLRLNAKPGITGLWQVNGRSDLPFDEMVKYDLYYIERWCLWLDVKTILRTVAVVLNGKGAY